MPATELLSGNDDRRARRQVACSVGSAHEEPVVAALGHAQGACIVAGVSNDSIITQHLVTDTAAPIRHRLPTQVQLLSV